MAMPGKYIPPGKQKAVAITGKIPAPTGPSASAPKPSATNLKASSQGAGSQATDWKTTNAIRSQKLQTQQGMSASDAKKLTTPKKSSGYDYDDDSDSG